MAVEEELATRLEVRPGVYYALWQFWQAFGGVTIMQVGGVY